MPLVILKWSPLISRGIETNPMWWTAKHKTVGVQICVAHSCSAVPQHPSTLNKRNSSGMMDGGVEFYICLTLTCCNISSWLASRVHFHSFNQISAGISVLFIHILISEPRTNTVIVPCTSHGDLSPSQHLMEPSASPIVHWVFFARCHYFSAGWFGLYLATYADNQKWRVRAVILSRP